MELLSLGVDAGDHMGICFIPLATARTMMLVSHFVPEVCNASHWCNVGNPIIQEVTAMQWKALHCQFEAIPILISGE